MSTLSLREVTWLTREAGPALSIPPAGFLMCPWPGGLVGWGVVLHTDRLWVQFPIRAHTWVVGSVPGHMWEQPTKVPLSLPPGGLLSSPGPGCGNGDGMDLEARETASE